MYAIPDTAFVVFGSEPMLDARKRGWGETGRAIFRPPALPDRLADQLRAYHFVNGAPALPPPGSGTHYRRQRGEDFAARLANCLEDLAREGHRQVVLVGTDCPEIGEADILEAYRAVCAGGSALGPDDKGGVYLIAIRLEDRHRLSGIDWCRNVDLRQLRQRLGHRPLHCLATHADLDGTRDLRRLARRQAGPALMRITERILNRILPMAVRGGHSRPLVRGIWIRRMLKYRDAPPAGIAAGA
ncbi:MAG: DUF2064 domain-containing protein [Opitutales bacterium]